MNQKLVGAQAERNALRAKLMRVRKSSTDTSARAVIDDLLLWLKARTARYNRRPGGLQSKKR